MNWEKVKNIIMFNRVTDLDRLLFTKYLSEMLKSGIPVDEAISTAKDQSKNKFFQKIMAGVEQSVKNGQSLHKSLAKYPDAFNPLFTSLVKVGEESGNLEENLGYLATQIKKSYEFNKKVQGAMLYPGIILATTVIAGGGLAIFVLPQLVDLFKSLNSNLPLSTKILLWTAQTMKDYGILIGIGAVLLFISFGALIQTSFVKPKWHRFLLSLPGIGVLLQNIQLTNLNRNIGLMLKSGVTLVPALKTEYEAMENLVYKAYVRRLINAAETGRALSEEMRMHRFTFLPAIMTKMVGIGEKTGKLDETLLYLGDFFEEEVDETTKSLSTIIEPVLLLVIGLVVGFIALAIISPIYELTGSIKK